MLSWNIQCSNIAGPHNGAVSSATGVQTKKHKQHRKPISARGRDPGKARAQKRKSPARRSSARAVGGKRPVLTGRRRESEAKTESRPAIELSGINKKGPLEDFLKGSVNPAATYSPGPGGQVPSAI